ncbi:MAG: hypothetical protein O2843_09790 [Chloroflexi bacterium]|nr:hypothetical protein [Chloroflexota bacterium]
MVAVVNRDALLETRQGNGAHPRLDPGPDEHCEHLADYRQHCDGCGREGDQRRGAPPSRLASVFRRHALTYMRVLLGFR